MATVRAQRKRDKQTSSDEDYGWIYGYWAVKPYYWQKRNQNGGTEALDGGFLDQDEGWQKDYGTMAWLVGMAENILDKEETDKELARQAQRGIR